MGFRRQRHKHPRLLSKPIRGFLGGNPGTGQNETLSSNRFDRKSNCTASLTCTFRASPLWENYDIIQKKRGRSCCQKFRFTSCGFIAIERIVVMYESRPVCGHIINKDDFFWSLREVVHGWIAGVCRLLYERHFKNNNNRKEGFYLIRSFESNPEVLWGIPCPFTAIYMLIQSLILLAGRKEQGNVNLISSSKWFQ